VVGGLDAGKYFWRSGREKCFSLDIPFYRTSGLLVIQAQSLDVSEALPALPTLLRFKAICSGCRQPRRSACDTRSPLKKSCWFASTWRASEPQAARGIDCSVGRSIENHPIPFVLTKGTVRS